MKKKVLIILMFIIVSFLIFNHTSYAKYVSNSIWDYYLNSNKFYFESDYLAMNSKKNIYNSWDGNSISFNLTNGLNNKLYTKDDISYEVTCSIDDSNKPCLINGEDVYKSILKGNKLSTDILSINIDNDIALANVKVIAKSISPYKKTLVANFELNKLDEKNDISYDIEKLDNYSKLNISNASLKEKCLHISFPSNNIRVLQTSLMKNIGTDTDGYINEFDINVKENDVVSIDIYSMQDIDKDDFTVLACQ